MKTLLKNNIKQLKNKYKNLLERINKRYNLLLNILSVLPKRFNKRFKSVKANKKRILILPSDYSFGSFGDQAMVCSLLEEIKHKYNNPDIALFLPRTYKHDNILLNYGYNIKIYYPKEAQKSYKLFSVLASMYDELYVIGADILDGGWGENLAHSYYKYITIAHKLGLKTYINGFSFNSDKTPSIIDEIKRISNYTVLNARDEISFSRLKEIGCKNLRQTADIAFLFNEDKYTSSIYCDKLIEKLNNLKTQGNKLIGLHITYEKNEAKYILEKLAKIFKEFSNTTIVILPHDKRIYRNKLTDREIIEEIENYFNKNNISCINSFELENEADVKKVIKFLDLVITSRMHLAIASFSRCVPVISFVYQGKFEGLYKFYNFEQNMMFDKNKFDESELKSIIYYLINNKDNICKKIKQSNQYIFKLSYKNVNK